MAAVSVWCGLAWRVFLCALCGCGFRPRTNAFCNLSTRSSALGSAPVALASLLFDPPEPQNIGKELLRDFSTFSLIFHRMVRGGGVGRRQVLRKWL